MHACLVHQRACANFEFSRGISEIFNGILGTVCSLEEYALVWWGYMVNIPLMNSHCFHVCVCFWYVGERSERGDGIII